MLAVEGRRNGNPACATSGHAHVLADVAARTRDTLKDPQETLGWPRGCHLSPGDLGRLPGGPIKRLRYLQDATRGPSGPSREFLRGHQDTQEVPRATPKPTRQFEKATYA